MGGNQMQVLNSFHEPLLPIGTILMYKKVKVEIVEYSDIHDGKDYVIQPVGESVYYQRIARYDDEHLEEIE